MYRGHEASRQLREQALRFTPWGTQTGSKRPENLFDSTDRPAFAARAEGALLSDVDGNTYIDYVMSLGPIVLGHGHPEVMAAVARQWQDGVLFSAASPLEAAVAERICRLLPGADWVRFLKSGAEACSAAVRVARAATGRERIATCGYFGWHDAFNAGAGIPAAVQALRSEFAWDDPQGLEQVLAAHPGEFAAVMLEPFIISEAPAFLAQCRDLAQRHGALLIFDEIKTGVRFGPGGAQGRYGVVPDLTVLGKAIGNGMPISALCGRQNLRPALERLWISGTYNGDALSLAACLAVLTVVEREDPSLAIWARGQRLIDGVRRGIAETGAAVTLLGCPAMWLLRFAEPALEREFLWAALQDGVWFKRDAYNFVSCAHTDEQIETSIAVARRALHTALKAVR